MVSLLPTFFLRTINVLEGSRVKLVQTEKESQAWKHLKKQQFLTKATENVAESL